MHSHSSTHAPLERTAQQESVRAKPIEMAGVETAGVDVPLASGQQQLLGGIRDACQGVRLDQRAGERVSTHRRISLAVPCTHTPQQTNQPNRKQACSSSAITLTIPPLSSHRRRSPS